MWSLVLTIPWESAGAYVILVQPMRDCSMGRTIGLSNGSTVGYVFM